MFRKTHLMVMVLLVFLGTVETYAAMEDVSCRENIEFNISPIMAITDGVSSRGTGFLISENGHILTNQHVIDTIDFNDVKMPKIDETINSILQFTLGKCLSNCADEISDLKQSESYVVSLKIIALGDPKYSYCGTNLDCDNIEGTHPNDFALLQITSNNLEEIINKHGYLTLENLESADNSVFIDDTLQYAGYPDVCGDFGKDDMFIDPIQYDSGGVKEYLFDNTAVRINMISDTGASGSPVFNEKNEVVALLYGRNNKIGDRWDQSDVLLNWSFWDSIKKNFPPTKPDITFNKNQNRLFGIVEVSVKAEDQQGKGITSFVFKVDGQQIHEEIFNDISKKTETKLYWDTSEFEPCYTTATFSVEVYDNDGLMNSSELPITIENNLSISVDPDPSSINTNSQFTISGKLTSSSGLGIYNEKICALFWGSTDAYCSSTDSEGGFIIDLFSPPTPGNYNITVYTDTNNECSTGATKPISVIDPKIGYNLKINTFSSDASSGVEPGSSITLSANFDNIGTYDQDLIVDWYIYPPGSGVPEKSSLNNNYGNHRVGTSISQSETFTLENNSQTGYWSASVLINTSDEDLSDNYKMLRFYVGSSSESVTTYKLYDTLQDEYTTKTYSSHTLEVSRVSDSDCSTQYKLNGSSVTLDNGEVEERDNNKLILIHENCDNSQNPDKAFFKLLSHPPDTAFSVTPIKTAASPGGEVLFLISKNPRNLDVISEYADGSDVYNWTWGDKSDPDDTYDDSRIIYGRVPVGATSKTYSCILKFQFSGSNNRYAQRIEFEVISEPNHDISVDNINPSSGSSYQSGTSIPISAQINSANGLNEFPVLTMNITGPDNYSYEEILYQSINGNQTVQFSNWNTIGVTPGEYSISVTADILDDSNLNNNVFTITVSITEFINQTPIANSGGPYSGTVNEPILFDASESFDLDGSITLYEWDWNNDGIYDDVLTDETIEHIWNEKFSDSIVLRVTDDNGFSDTDETFVNISDSSNEDILSDIIITNYIFIEEKRISRTVYEFTFQVEVKNIGNQDKSNIDGLLTIDSQNTIVTDGNLFLGDVASGATVLSQDTISIQHDMTLPFDGIIKWSFTGIIDNTIDLDQDGFSLEQGDCDDNDSNVYPGALEICGDNIDQNCDGTDLTCLDSNFSDNFNDGDFTNNPTWNEINGDDCSRTVDIVNNSLHFDGCNIPGNGGTSGISIDTNIMIDDSTKVVFDGNAVSRTVGAGCGWSCGEFPVNAQLTLKDSDGQELTVRYSLNYGSAIQDKNQETFKQICLSVPQNQWVRDIAYTIRDAWPNAVKITNIFLFAAGWDYEGYIDNFAIKNGQVSNTNHESGWRYSRGNLENTGSTEFVGKSQENNFSPSFSLNSSNGLVDYATNALTGDVDGDKLNDIVIINSDILLIHYGDTNKGQVMATIPSNSYHAILEDVSEDGILDIIVGSYKNEYNQISIYKGDASLLKTVKGRIGSGWDRSYSRIMPLTYLGDGKIAASYSSGYSTNPRGYTVIDINDGNEGNELWYYDIGPIPGSTAVVDINNDGLLEFLSSMFTPHNGGTGTSGTPTNDLNLYLIMVNENGQEIFTQIFGNDTSGGANGGNYNIISDLENDGNYEIIATVGHYSSYPGDAQIRIMNATNGSELHRVSVGHNAGSIVFVADMDNDGVKEIIFNHRTNGTITIFDNNLNSINSINSSGYIKSIADIDGDGYKEILLSDNSAVLCLGGSNFNQEWSVNMSSNVSNVIPTDIDADGYTEIVVTENGMVTVLEGPEM